MKNLDAVTAPEDVPTKKYVDDRLLSGFRNVIRNGDMGIAQRGNGPFTTHNFTYCVDGWLGYKNGGTMSVTRGGEIPGTNGPLLIAAVSGQAGADDLAMFFQKIEDVNTLAGETVTLSFLAKASTGTPKIGTSFQQAFGSGGSSPVNSPSTSVTISTTLTRYSLALTVPSIAGKTVGAGSSLTVYLYLSAGANESPGSGGIPIQNDTFSITDVQLEEGSVATPFERLPIQQQLAWCQRYFQRRGASNPNMPEADSWVAFSVGFASSATAGDTVMTHVVPMRATPTVVAGGGMADFWFTGPTFGVQPSSLDLYGITAYDTQIVVNGAGFAVGTAKLTQRSTNVGAYIDFSAEL